MNQFEQEIQEKEAELRNVKAEQERLSAIGNDNPSLMQELKDKEIAISTRLKELCAIQDQDKEREQREQRHAVNVGGLMDKLIESGLYERVYGERPEGERIYEYEDNRKNFYMAINSLMEEEKETDRQYYEEQLANREEKIKRLTLQGNDTENQLAAEREKVSELNDQISALNAEAAESEEILQRANAERDAAIEQLELEKSKHSITLDQFNRLGEVCSEKNVQIEKLEAKLEQAQRQKASATTDSTKDLIASLKPAASWGTQADIAMRRISEKAHEYGLAPLTVPPLEPVSPFRINGEEADKTYAGDNGIHTTEMGAEVTGEQFRMGAESQSEQAMVGDGPEQDTRAEDSKSNYQHVSETVSREEHEALKKRVEALENNVARAAA